MSPELVVAEVWSNADDWEDHEQHLATVYVDFECGCWTSSEKAVWTKQLVTRECREGHT